MGKVGTSLTRAKVDVLCLDIALELMELSYEAYYDPSGQSTESGFGMMNLERHGYCLLDSKYYAELDTVCYICRNITKHRLVVVFRYEFVEHEISIFKKKIYRKTGELPARSTGIPI